jgi:hypothetical protein
MEDTQTQQVVRAKDGKWIVPPKSPAPITHANARMMAQKRWEKYRRAAVKRIVGEAQSVDLEVSTGADAFALAAAKQFTALLDSDKPVLGQLKELGALMTGMDASQSQRENASTPPGSITFGSADTLAELMVLLEKEKQLVTEQARAIDAGA